MSKDNIIAVASVLIMAVVVVAAVTRDTGTQRDEALFRIRIEAADPEKVSADLIDSGYDLDEIGRDENGIEAVASGSDIKLLENRGLEVVVLEKGRPLKDVFREELPAAVTPLSQVGYSTVDGIVAKMNDIANQYPDIAQVVDLTAKYGMPPTFEGRHLYALKISDNVAADEDEPTFLMTGAVHAREVVTPVINLYAAERLTSGYASDPAISSAVNNYEIWIAPLWNPDGYNYVYTVNHLWRKNRRVFPSGTGVDLNRNFPVGWDSACDWKTTVSSIMYRGPSPFSEAETQTIFAWSKDIRFAKVIDYHSPGRFVYYGYRCFSHPFNDWMRQEAEAFSAASSYGSATSTPFSGTLFQWQFAQMGVHSFLIETSDKFQPSYTKALEEAVRVWPGVLNIINRPITISGHVTDAVTGLPLEASVEITNVNFVNDEANSSGGAQGTYYLFVPPGTYSVRFSRDGYAPETYTVNVPQNDSAIVLDVQLSPASASVEFLDDFESDRGWIRNPNGTDTATKGWWERGVPQATSSSGPKQLSSVTSGTNDLVTGKLSGSSASTYDVDGGISSIQSPAITLPSSGDLTLSFNYYFSHNKYSSTADFFRVKVVGSSATKTVLEKFGSALNVDAAWVNKRANLAEFAGDTVKVLIEAADLSTDSLVEAAVDDVKVVYYPAP